MYCSLKCPLVHTAVTYKPLYITSVSCTVTWDLKNKIFVGIFRHNTHSKTKFYMASYSAPVAAIKRNSKYRFQEAAILLHWIFSVGLWSDKRFTPTTKYCYYRCSLSYNRHVDIINEAPRGVGGLHCHGQSIGTGDETYGHDLSLHGKQAENEVLSVT
jgi:hypothetical protein